MIRRLATTLGAIALVVACVLAITTLSPAALPRVTKVAPPRDTKTVCVPAVDGGVAYVGGAEAAGRVGTKPARTTDPVVLPGQTQPVVATGSKPLFGGFLSQSGATAEWVPCAPALATGSLVVPSSAETELLVVNSDPVDASVDLTIHGPDGEIAALGARGIAVAANSSQVIALSVLAPVSGPVAVDYVASRGRATILARTKGVSGLTAIGASAPDVSVLLPGVPAKASVATLVLANTTSQRATVDVTAYGTTPGYQPAGGQGIEVPAHTTLAVPLVDALAGEATAFRVASDVPISAALLVGLREPALVGPVTAGTELSAVVPAGGQLQVATTSEAPVTVTVTDTVGTGQPVTTEVTVPAKSLATLALAPTAPEGHVVQVTASAEVFGVVSFVSAAGGVVVPLQSTSAVASEPLAAELDPMLN